MKFIFGFFNHNFMQYDRIYYNPLLPAEINATQEFYIFFIFIWSSIISDNRGGGDVIVHEDIFIFGSELGEFDIFYKFGNFVFFAKFEELSCFWISNKEDFSSFGGGREDSRTLWISLKSKEKHWDNIKHLMIKLKALFHTHAKQNF